MEENGVEVLIDANRRKPNIKNRFEEVTEAAVTSFALEQPAFGQVRVSNELDKRGIFVSPSGVRSIWPSESGIVQEASVIAGTSGSVLTEAQVAVKSGRGYYISTVHGLFTGNPVFLSCGIFTIDDQYQL